MKEYTSPAILINEYEISDCITTSSPVADGLIDDRDDDTLDMTGGV